MKYKFSEVVVVDRLVTVGAILMLIVIWKKLFNPTLTDEQLAIGFVLLLTMMKGYINLLVKRYAFSILSFAASIMIAFLLVTISRFF